MTTIIRLITGARSAWVVALLGVLLAAGVVAGVGQAERDPSPLDGLPAGYDSTAGQELLGDLPTRAARSRSCSSRSRTDRSPPACPTWARR